MRKLTQAEAKPGAHDKAQASERLKQASKQAIGGRGGSNGVDVAEQETAEVSVDTSGAEGRRKAKSGGRRIATLRWKGRWQGTELQIGRAHV